MKKFKVISEFTPKGDQPAAIKKLKNGIDNNIDFQTLMGITGSGKSATIAWLIEEIQKPTLVLAPNKALAAQLANEFKQFFPENRVFKWTKLILLNYKKHVDRIGGING